MTCGHERSAGLPRRGHIAAVARASVSGRETKGEDALARRSHLDEQAHVLDVALRYVRDFHAPVRQNERHAPAARAAETDDVHLLLRRRPRTFSVVIPGRCRGDDAGRAVMIQAFDEAADQLLNRRRPLLFGEDLSAEIETAQR